MLGSIKRVKEKYNKIPLPVKAGMFFLICTVLQNGLNFITYFYEITIKGAIWIIKYVFCLE